MPKKPAGRLRPYDCANLARSPLLRHGTNARSANHRRTHDDDDDVEDDSLQLSIPVEARGRQDLGWSLSRQGTDAETLRMGITFINQGTFTSSKTTKLRRDDDLLRGNRSSFICADDRDL